MGGIRLDRHPIKRERTVTQGPADTSHRQNLTGLDAAAAPCEPSFLGTHMLTERLFGAASGTRQPPAKRKMHLNRVLPLGIVLAAVTATAVAGNGPGAAFYLGAGHIHTSADDDRGTGDGTGAKALGGWWWEREHALEFDVAVEEFGEAQAAETRIVEIGVSGYDYQRPGRPLNPYVMAGVQFLSSDAGEEDTNALAGRIGAGLAVDCCWGGVLRLGVGFRQQFGGAAGSGGSGETDFAETQFTVEWLFPFEQRRRPEATPASSLSLPAERRERQRQAIVVHFPLQSVTLTPQARASLDRIAAGEANARPVLIIIAGSRLDRLSPLQSDLDEQRLRRIADYLREAGIPAREIALSPSGRARDKATIELRAWHP